MFQYEIWTFQSYTVSINILTPGLIFPVWPLILPDFTLTGNAISKMRCQRPLTNTSKCNPWIVCNKIFLYIAVIKLCILNIIYRDKMLILIFFTYIIQFYEYLNNPNNYYFTYKYFNGGCILKDYNIVSISFEYKIK